MPVAEYQAYCAFLRARAGRFALPVVNEAAMAERVKQAAKDLRATRKTMFAS